jgi:hypothetical protein
MLDDFLAYFITALLTVGAVLLVLGGLFGAFALGLAIAVTVGGIGGIVLGLLAGGVVAAFVLALFFMLIEWMD